METLHCNSWLLNFIVYSQKSSLFGMFIRPKKVILHSFRQITISESKLARVAACFATLPELKTGSLALFIHHHHHLHRKTERGCAQKKCEVMNIICVTPQVCGGWHVPTFQRGHSVKECPIRTSLITPHATHHSRWWVQVSSKWSYKWTAHDHDVTI